MYCPHCGAQLKFDDAEICPSCGMRIKEPPVPQSNEPVIIKQRMNEHPCFIGCGSAIMALPLLFGIVLIGAAFFTLPKDPIGAILCGIIGIAFIGGVIVWLKKASKTQK